MAINKAKNKRYRVEDTGPRRGQSEGNNRDKFSDYIRGNQDENNTNFNQGHNRSREENTYEYAINFHQ